jgi:NAD dependent epimerase/dehydratase
MTSFKRVLVTGADGFIGSHLTEALVRAGYNVRAFVCYNSFNSWGWLDSAPTEIKNSLDVFSGDVRDTNGVRQAVKGCDAVLHLAALIAIPYSYHSPASYVDTNIHGTLNVLQAVSDLDVCRMVHTSTSEVYGSAQNVPITEDHPLQGQSPYAATKIGADQLALSFHKSFDTPVAIMRPFNTYGPRQSARAVIPTVISQLLAGKEFIKMGSLSPTRDFNFVQDITAAFIAMLEAKDFVGDVINAGSNFEISIADMVNVIKKVTGVDAEIITDDQRIRPELSEVDRLWASNERAREILNWSPAYGGLDGFERGISETVEWFRNPENLPQYKTETFNL